MPASEPAAIIERLASACRAPVLAAHPVDKHPRIEIEASDWRAVAELAKAAPDLAFDWLACLGGVDYAADGKMAIVVELWSTVHNHRIAVKAFTPRETPAFPSVADLWPAADWQEREAFDLFGINFPGHSNLQRILMADDWVGFPLRKDYVFPREVHGIPGSVELDWQQKG